MVPEEKPEFRSIPLKKIKERVLIPHQESCFYRKEYIFIIHIKIVDAMKRTPVLLSLIVILLSSTLVMAESPALLTTTMIRGGVGVTAKLKNTGNMTATNITCGCLMTSDLTNRTTFVAKELIKIGPNKEVTLHFIFFFFGDIDVTVGAFGYFNGVEYVQYALPNYDAFAFGPFVKMLETP